MLMKPVTFSNTIAPVFTSDGTANVLQLSDLHLYLDVERSVAGNNCQKSFEGCLEQALGDGIRCDFILITGDLVNEVDTRIYDRVFSILKNTGIPHACIAGNHDVTDEIGDALPFHERQLVPRQADSRLLSNTVLSLNNWQVLLLDSSIMGSVGGHIPSKSLEWLTQTLNNNQSPTLIALHHHVTPIASKWIDSHLIANADEFWHLIDSHTHVKAIVTGHIHQEYHGCYHGVQIFATPSTCYQFSPTQDTFGIDTYARPGYRWLQLKNDQTITSWVSRLEYALA